MTAAVDRPLSQNHPTSFEIRFMRLLMTVERVVVGMPPGALVASHLLQPGVNHERR
jgi:hypothetical protein